MTSPRVVITGMGLITPLGNTPQQVWQALRAGKSGVGPLTEMGTNDFPFVAGGKAWDFRGEVDDFGPLAPGPKKAIRKGLKMMCREIQMGIAASQRAIADAGDIARYGPDRIGVVFGVDHITTEPIEFAGSIRSCRNESGNFDFSRWGAHGLPQITPLWLLKYLPNMPASHVAIYNDFRGPSNSLTMREAAGNLAVGEAFAVIQRGAADAMLVGATGTRLHLLRSLHIALQETVHTDCETPPKTWSRPFDLDRRGMVLAEGSAAIVLEKESSARARGATIWGEVTGTGSAMAGHSPSRSDLRQSLTISALAALRRAQLVPHDLGHIHAHGASTLRMDAAEATALHSIFGPRTPVTTLKGYTGNMGAGSGLAELICSVVAMHEGTLFPTLNYDTPDPACPLGLVSGGCWDRPAGNSMLNVSLTPQGQSSTVIVSKCDR